MQQASFLFFSTDNSHIIRNISKWREKQGFHTATVHESKRDIFRNDVINHGRHFSFRMDNSAWQRKPTTDKEKQWAGHLAKRDSIIVLYFAGQLVNDENRWTWEHYKNSSNPKLRALARDDYSGRT
jgi:hypothetical protein